MGTTECISPIQSFEAILYNKIKATPKSLTSLNALINMSKWSEKCMRSCNLNTYNSFYDYGGG